MQSESECTRGLQPARFSLITLLALSRGVYAARNYRSFVIRTLEKAPFLFNYYVKSLDR